MFLIRTGLSILSDMSVQDMKAGLALTSAREKKRNAPQIPTILPRLIPECLACTVEILAKTHTSVMAVIDTVVKKHIPESHHKRYDRKMNPIVKHKEFR